MGLGLGDALRQIVALTEERDSALVICQEKDDGQIQAESILVEVQSKLEAEMNQRASHRQLSDSERTEKRSFVSARPSRQEGHVRPQHREKTLLGPNSHNLCWLPCMNCEDLTDYLVCVYVCVCATVYTSYHIVYLRFI